MILLDVVQEVLSSIESDRANSVTDNEETLQAANIVGSIYRHLTSQVDFPSHMDFFELEASGDIEKPVLMYIPPRVKEVSWVKYDVRVYEDTQAHYRDIPYCDPQEFFLRMHALNQDEENVSSFVIDGVDTLEVVYQTDRGPSYYTSLDDHRLIFDAYDQEVDGTLQKTKTVCHGLLSPREFELTDSFSFDLPEKSLDLLITESKAVAWVEMKQTQNVKLERMARRGWTKTQNEDVVFHGYGRFPGKYGK